MKNKILKIIKVILVNIILIFCLLALLELCFYNIYKKNSSEQIELYEKEGTFIAFRYTNPKIYNIRRYKYTFRTKKGTSNKAPILFIGGSYTKGSFLKDSQTLAYKVSEITNRTTYKRGICGGGLAEILDQLETGLMKKDVPNAEYIFYTFISPHIDRLFQYQLNYFETFISLRYKLKNNKLVKIEKPKFPLLYSLFSIKYFQNLLTEKYYTVQEISSGYPLFIALLKECMKHFKEQYPNTKIVILLYPHAEYAQYEKGKEENIEQTILPFDLIQEIEKMGYIVVNVENIVDEPIRNYEYRAQDKDHPNEAAWNVVAPALVEKFNL